MISRFKRRQDWTCFIAIGPVESFPQLQQWLEALTKKVDQLLVYLHAASLNCALPPTLSFRQTKVFSGICSMLMVVSVMEYAQCFWTGPKDGTYKSLKTAVILRPSLTNFLPVPSLLTKMLLCVHCSLRFIPVVLVRWTPKLKADIFPYGLHSASNRVVRTI